LSCQFERLPDGEAGSREVKLIIINAPRLLHMVIVNNVFFNYYYEKRFEAALKPKPELIK